MNPFTVIREACGEATLRGIRLDRGATFDYTGCRLTVKGIGPWCGPLPKACNALGAVLLSRGVQFSRFPWTFLKNHLDVWDHWLYRFSIGWDQRHVLQVAITNKNGDIIDWINDDVSLMARNLSKELVVLK